MTNPQDNEDYKVIDISEARARTYDANLVIHLSSLPNGKALQVRKLAVYRNATDYESAKLASIYAIRLASRHAGLGKVTILWKRDNDNAMLFIPSVMRTNN